MSASDVTDVPQKLLDPGLRFHGSRFFTGPSTEDPEIKVNSTRAFHLRDDDVLVLAFPKCGTHWLWEITKMLLNGSAEISKKVKEFCMLEMTQLENIDKEESPRVINSHNFFCHLPQELFTKKTKIIHIVRNPKDTFTSFYHMMSHRHPDLSFDGMLKAYMQNKLSREHQLSFEHQMAKFVSEHPDHPVITLHYEDMKQDPVKGITQLAEFLGVPKDESFFQKVATATSFENMKSADAQRIRPERGPWSGPPGSGPPGSGPKKGGPNMYRKGEIGDWKNHFSDAMNEEFEKFLVKEAEGLPFTFKYGQ